jgi:hypothetical protein
MTQWTGRPWRYDGCRKNRFKKGGGVWDSRQESNFGLSLGFSSAGKDFGATSF